ncbi:MAG: hypothetical protein DWQ10_18755 [Calditrichaeota bacterium]|nr:MAG: hypothetical protein DWQ10_18755 [Calditrichota bacterium]
MENKYVLEKEIGKGLVMLANIVAGGLMFGQVFDEHFSVEMFFVGLAFTIILYISTGRFFKRIK